MRLALGQMNATIGDFAGNGAKTEALRREAEVAHLRGELTRRAGKTALLAGTFGYGRRMPIAQVTKA